MKQLRFLLKKEFLQIRRNSSMLRFIMMMPIIQLILLPWAATFEQKNINLSIVDNDKSSYSREMIQKITSSGYFKLVNYSESYRDGLNSLETNKADIFLEIPNHFENNFVNQEPTSLMITVNAVNGQKATVGFSYLSQILNSYNKQLLKGNLGGVELKPYYKYNNEMSYQTFMVPGILVILLTAVGGMMSAMNIVREKEIGTMEQMNVTPVSKPVFILSKLVPFWIIGLVLLSIGMLVARLIYGLIPSGHIIDIYIYAFLYLIAFTGFGLMISNFASTQQQAMFIIFFFLIVFILFSGLFTPISSMPQWAQWVAAINPLTYFVDVIRLIYMKGSNLLDVISQVGKIIIFIIVFNVLAILTYKKTIN